MLALKMDLLVRFYKVNGSLSPEHLKDLVQTASPARRKRSDGSQQFGPSLNRAQTTVRLLQNMSGSVAETMVVDVLDSWSSVIGQNVLQRPVQDDLG